MRLLLTEYINTLKEDGELDALIQDILKANGIAIFSRPERGRQYGVDIYAIGPDFEDNRIEKVFLISVKQGDLDRRTWDLEQNSIRPSLDEIKDTFIRNNLAEQHKHLPIKIVVAFNGLIKTAVQQNWRGYTENNSQYEYTLWTEGWLLKQFEEHLLNEQAFSSEIRSLFRKTIIHVDVPDYDFHDYALLLELIRKNFNEAKHKKAKLKILRELNVIASIILKYCVEADNLLHAVKMGEQYILALGSIVFPGEGDKEFTLCFVNAFHTVLETYMRYFHKIAPVAMVRDGLSKNIKSASVYTDIVYRQVGIFAISGLVVFQLRDIIKESPGDAVVDLVNRFDHKLNEIATTLVAMINNNMIFYNPRSDDQHIEISLLFLFLQRLGLPQHIRAMLGMFAEQMGEAYFRLGIFPEYHNDKRTIAELDVDFEERRKYEYQSSTLLTVLSEWCAVVDDEETYKTLHAFKNGLLKEVELTLWLPEKETEEIYYNKYATRESGFALSGIALPETLGEYKAVILEEYKKTCFEKDFASVKQTIWTIGLMASRRYRTYMFPYYWRQYLK